MAAVVVTHDAELAAWADRVVLLRDGRGSDQTVQAPGPESLLAPGGTHNEDDGDPERPEYPEAVERGRSRAPRGRSAGRWRLLRREWRQQLLILALITVAVAATWWGLGGRDHHAEPGDRCLRHRAGPRHVHRAGLARRRGDRVDLSPLRHGRRDREPDVPGPRLDPDLQSARPNPRGPFGQPMLSLISGQFPVGADQVAVTSGVASDFHLAVGSTWTVGGVTRKVTGIAAEPAEPAR